MNSHRFQYLDYYNIYDKNSFRLTKYIFVLLINITIIIINFLLSVKLNHFCCFQSYMKPLKFHYENNILDYLQLIPLTSIQKRKFVFIYIVFLSVFIIFKYQR